MKKIIILTFAISMTYAQGTWTSLGINLATVSGFGAISFVIGDNAYYGTGARGFNTASPNNQTNAMWRFNGTWSQIAPVPDNGRAGAWAYALNGEGYVGGGAVWRPFSLFLDNYEIDQYIHRYNPGSGIWSSAFGGPNYARANATTGVLNGTDAYIIGGNNKYPFYIGAGIVEYPTFMRHVIATFSGFPVNSRLGPDPLPTNFNSVQYASSFSIQYAGNGIDNPRNLIGILGGSRSGVNGTALWTFNGANFNQTNIITPSAGVGSFSTTLQPDGVAYYGGNLNNTLASAFDATPFNNSAVTYSIAGISTISTFATSFSLGCYSYLLGGTNTTNILINQFLRYSPEGRIKLYEPAFNSGLSVCGGSLFTLTFQPNCRFANLSIPVSFNAEISDKDGNFSLAGVNVSTILGTESRFNSLVKLGAEIPTISGTNYKLRIYASVPEGIIFSNVINVTISSGEINAPTIVGPLTVCTNSLIPYSIVPVASVAGYNWHRPFWYNNGFTPSTSITGNLQTSTNIGNVGIYADAFNARGCFKRTLFIVRVAAGTPPPTTIIGPLTICNGSTVKYQSLTNITFQNTLIPASWSASTTTTSNAIIANTNYDFVSYANPFTTLKPIANVRGTNPGVQRLQLYMADQISGCVGGTPATMLITVTGAQIATISGLSTICAFNPSVYSANTTTDNTYRWSFQSGQSLGYFRLGNTTTSSSIVASNITFVGIAQGLVAIKMETINSCNSIVGSNLTTVTIQSIAVPNPIFGNLSVCKDQSTNLVHNELFPLPNGQPITFIWTSSNANVSIVGSINSGFNSVSPFTEVTYVNSATIKGINAGLASLSVVGVLNGCNSLPRIVQITVAGIPTFTASAPLDYLEVGTNIVIPGVREPDVAYSWIFPNSSTVLGFTDLDNSATITGIGYGKEVITITAINTFCGLSNTLIKEIRTVKKLVYYATTCAGNVPLYFNEEATSSTFLGYDLSNPTNKFMVDLRSPLVDFTTYGNNVVVDFGTVSGTVLSTLGVFGLEIDGQYKWHFSSLTIIGSLTFKPASFTYLSGNIVRVENGVCRIYGSTITGLPCSTQESDWNYLWVNDQRGIRGFDVNQDLDSEGNMRKTLITKTRNGLILTTKPKPNLSTFLIRNSTFRATNSALSVFNSPQGVTPLCAFCFDSYSWVSIYENQIECIGTASTTSTGVYVEYGSSQYNWFGITRNAIKNFKTNIRINGMFVVTLGNGLVSGAGVFCNSLSGSNSTVGIRITPSVAFDFNRQDRPSGNKFSGPATQIVNDVPNLAVTYYVGTSDQSINFTPGLNIQPSIYTSPCVTLGGGRFGSEEAESEKISTLGNPIPNPASYSVKIPYSLAIEPGQEASIAIYDIMGVLKAVMPLSSAEPNGELEVEISNYAAGIYVYRLIVAGVAIDTKKLMIVK